MTERGPAPETKDSTSPSSLNIGSDEWAARHGELVVGAGGSVAALVQGWQRLPGQVRWTLPLVAAAALPVLVANGYVLRIGVNLGLFALLALGLNVVVGYAGLLDLGFVAFYGFGAYGYAMLSSDKFGVHLPTLVSVPLVAVLTAALGALLGLPSRRLLGDYLAIVTLFFGQIFVELMLSADSLSVPWRSDPVDLTGGSNGIAGVDPFAALGFRFTGNRDYYYLLLVLVAVLSIALHRISGSRVGRAWRAGGEDALAAEAMTVPVNRLKLQAFVVGAGIAGLTGTVFCAVQSGVYPSSFDLPVLILLYAAVILGGSGSLVGTLVGAAVISVLPEVLRAPAYADVLFFGLLVLGVVGSLRRWRPVVLVAAGTAAFGYVANLLLLALGVPYLSAGDWTEGAVARLLGRWLFMPADRTHWGNVAFVLLIAVVALLSRLPGRRRLVLLPAALWLGIFVWEVRLVTEPSLTRQLVIGALLIVLMVVRPQGLFGRARVEGL